MAYLIHRKEPVDGEVRRVFAEQVEQARSRLSGWHENPRENIHQARQAFKRIRALLRLIRPGAPYVSRVEGRVFRGLGRALAYARDTEAVIDAVGILHARSSAPMARESLHALRVGLERRAVRELSGGSHDLAGRVSLARDELAAAADRIRDMPLDEIRRRHLRHGVEAARERCRSAFERAAGTRAAEDLHRWRSQVKCLFNQSRLMREILPDWAAGAGPVLEVLGRELGQHHDLVVLSRLLSGRVDDLGMDGQLQLVRDAARDARAEMAEAVLAAGSRLLSPGAPANRSNVVEFPARA